ncbi:nucleosome assembly protein 1-like 1 [Sycon ciliatum]|uniref:nucleosome assembly protein 1-like 1 n=1 Tax=Sycon ciliatum TaxID=27933 RepID=UPI0020A9A0BB|eukprot:scpid42959/ scgid22487/ Nucleosome assembly protein 1-like 1
MADAGEMGTSVDAPQRKGKRKGGRPTDDGAGDGPIGKLTSKLVEDPSFMEALTSQFGDRLGSVLSDKGVFYRSLPKQCKSRVRALKNLQVQNQELECQFHKELHQLECKFEEEFQSLCDRRKKIVVGEYEPTEEECTFALDNEEDEDEDDDEEKAENGEKAEESDADALAKNVDKVSLHESDYDENTKGLPHFWLTALQNVNMLQELIQDSDVAILKHLEDVKCTLLSEPVGFLLEFCFGENEFFSNRVLTKKYLMKIEVDPEDPFSFDGGEIYKCEGCNIEWKAGKNVTVKTIKKKQKNKKQGQTRTVTKQVKADSFFNFFNPVQLPDNEDEEVDEEVASAVAQDYELGLFLKENFVPKAVLYFTGEENDEEEDDEDDGEYDGEYDEDEDPDYKPPAGEQPQECKQQ